MKTNLNDGYWMGANDIQNEDNWVWVDGTAGIYFLVMYFFHHGSFFLKKNHISSVVSRLTYILLLLYKNLCNKIERFKIVQMWIFLNINISV